MVCLRRSEEVRVRRCSQCGGEVAREHRFLWCAARQRLKLVNFFPAHQSIARDRGKMLRVSHYVGVPAEERHVRFSVWNQDGVAEAAVSLGPAEARRLAAFVTHPCGTPPSRLSTLVAQVRADVEEALSRGR
jgi:hypothetical protein